jgi:hypothetical protein
MLLVLAAALATGCSQDGPPVPRVPEPGDLVVVPGTAEVETGGSLSFGATVVGAGDASVTWSVEGAPAAGSISDTGVYTAPAAPGDYVVVATSLADGRSARADVKVLAPPEATVDVTAYGAVGDGVADDTAAFRAAAATGVALRVPRPPAHYKITGPISLSASMYGADMPEIRLYGTGGWRGQHMFDVTENAGAPITIRGLRLNGQYVNGDGSGEWGHDILLRGATNVLIEGNELVGAKGDGVLVGGEGSPRLSENVTIRNNRFENPRRCTVAVIAGRNVRIESNSHLKTDPYVSAIDLEPNPYDPEWMEEVVIADNTFEVPGGIAILLWSWKENPYANRGITISGNRGTARRFIQKPNNMGTWERIRITGNTYQGDPGVPNQYVGFVEIVQDLGLEPLVVSDVVVQGNTITAELGSGQSYGDYFRGVRSLTFSDNAYTGSAPYAVTIVDSPSAAVSNNAPPSVVRY